MFTLKSWIEMATRVTLTAIIFLNALVPTAASAMSLPKQQKVAEPSAPVAQGAIGLATKYDLLSRRLPIAFQDETPGGSTLTVPLTETATATPTPEPSLEPAMTATDTP
jgi:hypothetical protein